MSLPQDSASPQAAPFFHAKETSHSLHNSLFGAVNAPDCACVGSVLARLTSKELEQLRGQYQQLYSRELIDDINAQIKDKPHLREAFIDTLTPPLELDADCLYKALHGLGPVDFLRFNEIVCCRSFEELEEIQDNYFKIFKKRLSHDIESKISSGTARLAYLNLLKKSRISKIPVVYSENASQKQVYSPSESDKAQMEKDVKEIRKASEGTVNFYVFLEILTQNPPEYISALNERYREVAGHSLLTEVEIKIKNDSKLLAILTTLLKPHAVYLANCLHVAGNDELMTTIISNKERCLSDINAVFFQQHAISLKDWIKDGITASREEKAFLFELIDHFS